MATDYKFPDLGEGVTEGEIKKWLVKEGDAVAKDQALAEVETDKAVVEMPSPVAGTVLKMNHKEGELVKVGEVLVVAGLFRLNWLPAIIALSTLVISVVYATRLLKGIVFGGAIPLLCASYGLRVKRSTTEIPQAVTKAAVASLLMVFLVGALISAALYG